MPSRRLERLSGLVLAGAVPGSAPGLVLTRRNRYCLLAGLSLVLAGIFGCISGGLRG
jgi:hypothetical protein